MVRGHPSGRPMNTLLISPRHLHQLKGYERARLFGHADGQRAAQYIQ